MVLRVPLCRRTQIKISKSDFDSINIQNDDFHGEWNYTIKQ